MMSPSDLAALLASCAGLDAAAIAERVESGAVGAAGQNAGGQPRDDVAILVVKLR